MNKKRRTMIAIITVILLIVLSLWLFTKASEDTEETGTTEQPVYQSYRNNILGVAGDFAVFTYGDASVSEVTADIAIGGNFSGQTFGSYNTNWEFYKANDLKFVNLNSYVRGQYQTGKYGWTADKSEEELTTAAGIVKGTYDVNNANGIANLYVYTGNGTNTLDKQNNNQSIINGIAYENYYRTDEDTGVSYNAYNTIGVDYEFIDFETEFNNLTNISESLMFTEGQEEVDCIPQSGKTYTYNFPEDRDAVLITLDADNFFGETCDAFNIEGLDANKKIVININCEGHLGDRSPRIEVNGSSADWNYLAENIIFNYYLPEFVEEQIEADQVIGTVLAPNMNIFINGNLDGAVLARKVTANNAIYGINSNIGWGDIQSQVVERTTISGTKKWNDKGEEDKRPEEITIKLLADGEETGDSVVLPKVITNDTSSDDSSFSTTGENDIEYYVIIDHSGISDWWAHSNKTFTVTIAYSNGQTKTVTATGAQLSNWGYNSDLAKITIPAGTTAEVTINAVETTTNYGTTVTLSENTAGINGLTGNWATFKLASGATNATATIVNGSEIEEPEEPETPTEDEDDNLDWTYKFTRLPKYKTVDGEQVEIKYTVEEVEVEGYVSEIVETDKGYDIINTIKTEITGEKIWDDDDNRDGKRPESIIVELYEKGKDGEEDIKVDEIEVKQGEEENTWSFKFEDVKKYDEDGKEIEYIVKEEKVDKYKDPVIEGNAEEGFKITNKYSPEKIDIKVTKVWDDVDNKENTRPEKIIVKLMADKKEKASQEIKADSDGKWEYTFEDLYKFEDGEEIEYTIEEVAVENYQEPVVTASGENEFTITNTYRPTTSVTVTKVWDDLENKENTRPENITVRVLAGEEEIDSKKITAEDEWKCTFTDLQKYDENGEEIVYVIKEDAVENYAEPVIEGNAKEGFTVTNKYTSTLSIDVTKKWNDANNQDNIRPESITIRLLADDEEVANKTITAEDEWKAKFTDLQKYNEEGTEIVYTITEDIVENYEEPVIEGDAKTGFTITNTHTTETITISGVKTWVDDDDKEGLRPESITVKLFADGKEVEDLAKTVTAEDEWKYSFADLPRYDEGTEIVYTIDEDAVEGYEKTIEGYNLTNTHTVIDAEEIEPLKIVKVWEDAGYEEFRPEKVTVNLLANGEIVETVEITANDSWEYTFRDMEKYDEEGKEIVYTVTEEAITGYETTIDGLKITNTYIPPVRNDEIVIKINKYQTGTTTKLEGAEFEIKVQNKDGKEVLKKTAETNTIGQIMLKDIELEAGDYKLIIKEKEAPEGYKIKNKEIKIEFTVSEDETGKQAIKLKEKYKNAEIEKMTITVKVENDKEKTQDKTTATGKLPQTGAGSMMVMISVVIAFVAIGAVGIFKYRDIKF